MIQFLQPRDELKPFISKIWLFENNNGFVNQGTVIAPNAKAKIIIPFKNDLTTTDAKKTDVCNEGNIHFIGIRDVPVTLGSSNGPTGSIGVEFNTEGAYRFTKIPMFYVTNGLFSFSELFGRDGNVLTERVANEADPVMKVNLLQDYLIRRLGYETHHSSLVDYAVHFISSSHGLTTVKDLERTTGYSKRYLDMLFKNNLGISPKTLATVYRFQHFYKNFRNREVRLPLETDIYNMYYDQSHFIKEFKRYTGFTPSKFSKINNDFGRFF